jgi:hypothetical protein
MFMRNTRLATARMIQPDRVLRTVSAPAFSIAPSTSTTLSNPKGDVAHHCPNAFSSLWGRRSCCRNASGGDLTGRITSVAVGTLLRN